MKKPLPLADLRADYAPTLAAYRAAGSEPALRIEADAREVTAWLSRVLPVTALP